MEGQKAGIESFMPTFEVQQRRQTKIKLCQYGEVVREEGEKEDDLKRRRAIY